MKKIKNYFKLAKEKNILKELLEVPKAKNNNHFYLLKQKKEKFIK